MNYAETRRHFDAAAAHLEELQRALQHARGLAWEVRCSHMPSSPLRESADEFLRRFDHLTNAG